MEGRGEVDLADAPGAPRGRPRLGQVGRFLVVGAANVVIDFAVFNLLVVISPSRNAGRLVLYNTVAIIVALANSYRWNELWTFGGRGPQEQRVRHRERVLFVIQGILNIGVNNGVLAGVTVALEGNHIFSPLVSNNVAKVLGVVTASATSFAAMKLVVFRHRPAGPGQ